MRTNPMKAMSPSCDPVSGRFPRMLAALLLVAVVLPYLFTLRHGWVYDDHGLIVENGFLADPANALRAMTPEAWSDTRIVNGRRPVVLLSLFFDRAAWGLNPMGYRLTNLALHVLAVFLLARWLGRRCGAVTGWIAAGLFGAHPIVTEVVRVPAFRADMLCAVFVLLFLLSIERARAAAWSPAALAAALLSKETALAAPFVAWVMAGPWFRGAPAEREDRPLVTWRRFAGAASIAVVALAFWSRSDALQAVGPAWNGRSLTWPHHLYSAPWTMVLSLKRLVAPVGLSVEYPFRPVASFGDPRAWGGLLALMVLTTGALVLARNRGRRQRAGLAGLWVLMWLLPSSNVLPLLNPLSDRYLYVPAMGIGWLLALGIEALPRKTWKTAVVTALILTAWTLSIVRLADWRSDRTLWEATLQSHPESERALVWLALEHKRDGDPAAARALLERAIHANPREASAYINLAILEGEVGRYDRAEALLMTALEVRPRSAPACRNLAVLREKQGRSDEARAWIERAREMDPYDRR